ncbi:MAG: hypothetical protein ACTHJ0_04800 [Flavipsychrobacter sp.]
MKKRLLVLIVFLFLAPAAWSQGCSMCTKTAASLGSKGAKGLNKGIIYLGFIPLSILGTIGAIWWKYNKNDESSEL